MTYAIQHQPRTGHRAFWQIAMALVLVGMMGVVGFLLYGKVNLQNYQGLLIPAIVFGLFIAFSTVYAMLTSTLETGERRRAELRSKIHEGLEKAEHLIQDEIGSAYDSGIVG